MTNILVFAISDWPLRAFSIFFTIFGYFYLFHQSSAERPCKNLVWHQTQKCCGTHTAPRPESATHTQTCLPAPRGAGAVDHQLAIRTAPTPTRRHTPGSAWEEGSCHAHAWLQRGSENLGFAASHLLQFILRLNVLCDILVFRSQFIVLSVFVVVVLWMLKKISQIINGKG